MNSLAAFRMIALASTLTASVSFAADGPPGWAYGYPPPGAPAAPAGGGGRGGQAPPDTSPKRLAGSNLEFTLTQIRDAYGPADWFPDDHPKMPEIVAHGRRPEVRACALCHYPNGKGRAENAPIAIAKAMTEEEIKASAEYFGSMPWTPWIKVMETEMVPKTRIAGGLFL